MAKFLSIPPALRHRKFTLYWVGLAISLAGSNMQLAALLWHLRELSPSPLVVSGIGVARFLPILLLAPIGGLVADAFNRRTIVFITQSVMIFTAAMLGWLTVSGQIQIWQIYLLTALQAVANSFDIPARQALMPNLIADKADLAGAFSLQSIGVNLGAVLGPALSGVVIAAGGLGWVYFINAASFTAVQIALLLMGKVEQEKGIRPGSVKGSLAAIREGWRFVWGTPLIVSTMLLDFFATFFASANTLLPFVARDILGVGALEYGWLSAAQSVGAVGVGLVISQRAQIRRQGRVLMFSIALIGIATILFGLTRTFWAALITLILIGAGDAVNTIIRNTLRQVNTPDALRGRMISLNQIFFQGGPQLGEIEAGIAAALLGVPFAIISGGVGTLIAMYAVARRWPQLPQYVAVEVK